MSGGGHNVRVLERAWGDPSGHQARNVGHVGKQVRTNLVTDSTESGIVQRPRVATHTGDDDLRFKQMSIRSQGVIVDEASGGVHLKERVFENKDFPENLDNKQDATVQKHTRPLYMAVSDVKMASVRINSYELGINPKSDTNFN